MVNCSTCGELFTPTNYKNVYCSDVCKREAKNRRRRKFDVSGETRECLICATPFLVSSEHPHQKYCSKKCGRRGERVFGNRYEVDLVYKDKIRFSGNRLKSLERDNYECQMCSNTTNLVVHHIDCSGQRDFPNNDLDNLLTLCRRCHINLHRILDKMKEEFTCQ